MEDFLLHEFPVYIGILGFFLLIFSFLSGMKYIKVNQKLRLHKKIGVIGFIFISIHALIMLFEYFFE